MIWLLHGNLGEKEDFLPLLALAEKDGQKQLCRPLSLWDLAVQFQQEDAEGHFPSLSVFGQKLTQLIEKQDPAPRLCGYSLGGRLALHALQAQPKLWQEVFLVSTHLGLELEEEKKTRLALDQKWARKLQEQGWPAFRQEWDAQAVFQSQQASLIPNTCSKTAPLTPSLEQQELFQLAFDHWSLGRQENFIPFLEEKKPLLPPLTLVVGAADTKFASHAQKAQEQLPFLRLASLPNKGHRVLLEAPEALWKLLSPRLS